MVLLFDFLERGAREIYGRRGSYGRETSLGGIGVMFDYGVRICKISVFTAPTDQSMGL